MASNRCLQIEKAAALILLHSSCFETPAVKGTMFSRTSAPRTMCVSRSTPCLHLLLLLLPLSEGKRISNKITNTRLQTRFLLRTDPLFSAPGKLLFVFITKAKQLQPRPLCQRKEKRLQRGKEKITR